MNATLDDPDMDELAKKKLVYVEPTNISETSANGQYQLVPYRERRGRWGWLFSAGASSYQPLNYIAAFAPPSAGYRGVYGAPTAPMLELRVAYKRNFALGSLGLELAGGFFRNANSDPAFVGSTLTLVPARVGAIYSMDVLAPEPYIVPYIAGGGYMEYYEESYNGVTVHGTTALAPYVNGGLAFSLNWIDRYAARVAYEEEGIENSFLYIEVGKYFQSSNKKDPDFSDTYDFGAGFRVEL